jgi:hypothetical protein
MSLDACTLVRPLSAYIMAEFERPAAPPTREEMRARLHGRKRVVLKTRAAVVIREERGRVAEEPRA